MGVEVKSHNCASEHTKELTMHFLLRILEVAVKIKGLQSGGTLQLHIIAPESLRPPMALHLLVHAGTARHYAVLRH